MGRPATGVTRGRNIRVSDPIWDAAAARAEADGTTISAEVVAFLRRYGKDHAGERVKRSAVSTETPDEVR